MKDLPDGEDESSDDAADASASDVGFCGLPWQTICVVALPGQAPEATPVPSGDRPDPEVEQSTNTPADVVFAAVPSPLAQPPTEVPPTNTISGFPTVTSAFSSIQAVPTDTGSADAANAPAADLKLAIDEAPAAEDRGLRQAPPQSARSLARALAILERVDPTDAAAQTTEVTPAAQRTPHADGAAAAALGRAAGTADSPVPTTSIARQAPAADAVSQWPTVAGAQAQSGGGAPSFGAASEGHGGSARQEYGRRAFAAVASLEPSLETRGAQTSPAPEPSAATTGPAVSLLRPSDVPKPHVVAAPQSPVDDGEVVSQLVRAMRTQFRDGMGEARIRLNPEHLGEVRIDIKIDGDRVSAVLQVERSDVRQAIEAQSHSLRSSLAAQGLNLEDLTVRQGERARDERGGADENRRGRDQPPPERRSRQRQPDREFELDGED